MANRRVKMVYLTEKLLKAKLLSKKPVWFEPLVKNPPLAEYIPLKEPTEIVLPIDPYIKEVYKRHPELLYDVYDPNSFEPFPAKNLALRIMELVDMGMAKPRATEIADAEFWNRRRKANWAYDRARDQAIREGREAPPPRKAYRQFQQLEWHYIKEGLKRLKQGEVKDGYGMQPMVGRYEEYDDDDDDNDD